MISDSRFNLEMESESIMILTNDTSIRLYLLKSEYMYTWK